MALTIELQRNAYAAGEVVRGVLRGLDAHPGARRVTVRLKHEARHLPDDETLSVGLEPAAGPAPAIPFDLPIPVAATPSFDGARFTSSWVVEAVADLPGATDVVATESLTVVPGPERAAAGEGPVTKAWGGFRAFRRFLGVFILIDLIALFAVTILVGSPPGFVMAGIAMPALLSLAALLFLSVRARPVDHLEIETSRRAWRFGEAVPVTVRCTGRPDAVVAIDIELTGEEVWVSGAGDETRTNREAFHRTHRRLAGADLAAVRSGPDLWTWNETLALPEGGLPSRKPAVQWWLSVAVEVHRAVDPVAGILLEVGGTVPGDERPA